MKPSLSIRPSARQAVLFGFVTLVTGCAVACSDGSRAPTLPSPPSPPPANTPPRITALRASNTRAEVEEQIQLTATVEDAESLPDNLAYEWSGPAGTFSGTGRSVEWKAPRGLETPASYELTLTVVERYRAQNPTTGLLEDREHRVSASIRIIVNDSWKEIREIALDFLADFSNSSVGPSICVRNFSDNCRGKAEELEDIRVNRATYVIVHASFSLRSITFDPARTSADIIAACEFISTVRATGQTEIARGECRLTAIYDSPRWWLCDSRFAPTSSTSLFPLCEG